MGLPAALGQKGGKGEGSYGAQLGVIQGRARGGKGVDLRAKTEEGEVFVFFHFSFIQKAI